MNKSILLLMSVVSLLFSQEKESVPDWLDTIPPIVTVLPSKHISAQPFSITFSSERDSKIYYSTSNGGTPILYKRPISMVAPGKKELYYYAEDVYGNRSKIKRVQFILDFDRPEITLSPVPGVFSSPVKLYIETNKPCRVYMHSDREGKDTLFTGMSKLIYDSLVGYISAFDSAGNRSIVGPVKYYVDTVTVNIAITPKPGIYNRKVTVELNSDISAKIFFSLNPNAIPDKFMQYLSPFSIPYGLTLLRYYAKKNNGIRGEIHEASFVKDTVAPKIRYTYSSTEEYDTLKLYTKERSTIRYILDSKTNFNENRIYNRPIVFEKTGRAYLNAIATDQAGNISKRFIWERKYDKVAPKIKCSHKNAVYNKPQIIKFKTDEPAKILYTTNGSDPTSSSPVYNKREGVEISKSGSTTLKYFAIDNAENRSKIYSLTINLDMRAPKVRAKLYGSAGDTLFEVSLFSDEILSTIRYELDGREPTLNSPIYTKKVSLPVGNILRYFAIDSAGNSSQIYLLDKLRKPLINPVLKGGVYSQYVNLNFRTTMESDIYYRTSNDSEFVKFDSTVILKKEGIHTIEYYAVAFNGLKSNIKNVSYYIDWTSPKVSISLKRGNGDSVSIFFNADENVSIYYTTDGSNPLFSRTTKSTGNKFTTSNARISLLREENTKLAYYAEDLAGNQTLLSIMDIFKPVPVPNLPYGSDRIYHKIISVSLGSYDERSQIYYERNGAEATLNSSIYTRPITLLESDTISAFVVDASGYRGKTEKFIYNINIPPSPNFSISPEIVAKGKEVTFDASLSLDPETPMSKLIYRWELTGDTIFDVEKIGYPILIYAYPKEGLYNVVLEVEDESGQKSSFEKKIAVRGYCPDGMVHVPRDSGNSFCIDKYEWPNKKGATPTTNVSWVSASMYCHDIGKKLCTTSQWSYSCSGGVFSGKNNTLRDYPYGNHYKVDHCPTEGETFNSSGSFSQCNERYGTFDMVGNVWEWVFDKENGAPMIMGGTFAYGEKSRCNYSSVSSVKAKDINTGFRCCR